MEESERQKRSEEKQQNSELHNHTLFLWIFFFWVKNSMPLLYSSPFLLYRPPSTAPTTNRHFPPQRPATCPSSSLRRRFASERKPLLPPLPLHSVGVFRHLNLQCSSSSSVSMSAEEEPTSTSQVSSALSRSQNLLRISKLGFREFRHEMIYLSKNKMEKFELVVGFD